MRTEFSDDTLKIFLDDTNIYDTLKIFLDDTNIPDVHLVLSSAPIVVKTRKLKERWTVDLARDLTSWNDMKKDEINNYRSQRRKAGQL